MKISAFASISLVLGLLPGDVLGQTCPQTILTTDASGVRKQIDQGRAFEYDGIVAKQTFHGAFELYTGTLNRYDCFLWGSDVHEDPFADDFQNRYYTVMRLDSRVVTRKETLTDDGTYQQAAGTPPFWTQSLPPQPQTEAYYFILGCDNTLGIYDTENIKGASPLWSVPVNDCGLLPAGDRTINIPNEPSSSGGGSYVYPDEPIDQGGNAATEPPSESPSPSPSESPSDLPSQQPTERPARPQRPTSNGQGGFQYPDEPIEQGEGASTDRPSHPPSVLPTQLPTAAPTDPPTPSPSAPPSKLPSDTPSLDPSAEPSDQPSAQPSDQPTDQPTAPPTAQPSEQAMDLALSIPQSCQRAVILEQNIQVNALDDRGIMDFGNGAYIEQQVNGNLVIKRGSSRDQANAETLWESCANEASGQGYSTILQGDSNFITRFTQNHHHVVWKRDNFVPEESYGPWELALECDENNQDWEKLVISDSTGHIVAWESPLGQTCASEPVCSSAILLMDTDQRLFSTDGYVLAGDGYYLLQESNGVFQLWKAAPSAGDRDDRAGRPLCVLWETLPQAAGLGVDGAVAFSVIQSDANLVTYWKDEDIQGAEYIDVWNAGVFQEETSLYTLVVDTCGEGPAVAAYEKNPVTDGDARLLWRSPFVDACGMEQGQEGEKRVVDAGNQAVNTGKGKGQEVEEGSNGESNSGSNYYDRRNLVDGRQSPHRGRRAIRRGGTRKQ